MDFTGKKVLITGGTRGIGLACASAIAFVMLGGWPGPGTQDFDVAL